MNQTKADDKVLSFADVVLRASDLEILEGPHYINDRIIEFCFADNSRNLPKDVILIPPSISFWIANCPDYDSLHDVVDPLDLPNKNLMIFTINDNDDVDIAEGGHHWSVMVYDREANLFIHHDSMPGMNGTHAMRLYKRVKECVGGGNSPRFVERETPKQENGYDCGLYVVAIVDVICRWHDQRGVGGMWFKDVMTQVDGKLVGGMREQILARINQLRC